MKNTLTTIIISLLTLLTAFAATVIPFRLFDSLTQAQMRILLFAEVTIYLTIFSAVCLKKEQRAQRKSKEQELKKRHRKRIEKRNGEMKGIKVKEFDLAA